MSRKLEVFSCDEGLFSKIDKRLIDLALPRIIMNYIGRGKLAEALSIVKCRAQIPPLVSRVDCIVVTKIIVRIINYDSNYLTSLLFAILTISLSLSVFFSF